MTILQTYVFVTMATISGTLAIILEGAPMGHLRDERQMIYVIIQVGQVFPVS